MAAFLDIMRSKHPCYFFGFLIMYFCAGSGYWDAKAAIQTAAVSPAGVCTHCKWVCR